MPQNEKLDSSARIIGWTFAAILLWGTTFAVASRILHHHPASVKLRAAAVIIGVLGFVSWPLATAKLIRAQDEFTRRIHLIALAIAFVATGLFLFTTDLLQRAGFINYVSLMTIWLVMLGAWCLAIMGAEWYYRR
jgi:hypothetical protein